MFTEISIPSITTQNTTIIFFLHQHTFFRLNNKINVPLSYLCHVFQGISYKETVRTNVTVDCINVNLDQSDLSLHDRILTWNTADHCPNSSNTVIGISTICNHCGNIFLNSVQYNVVNGLWKQSWWKWKPPGRQGNGGKLGDLLSRGSCLDLTRNWILIRACWPVEHLWRYNAPSMRHDTWIRGRLLCQQRILTRGGWSSEASPPGCSNGSGKLYQQ